jgi:X-linked retinitis pigmentosa GTPase regulator
VTLR